MVVAAAGLAGMKGAAADSTPLTELEPISVRQDWGQLASDQSVWGKPMQIGERKFTTGLGTHANSELVPAKFRVGSPGLEIELSDQGDIVGAMIGNPRAPRSLQGGTRLAGCTNTGPVATRDLANGGVEFMRHVVHAPSGQHAVLTDRFAATPDSVRWEIEIRGEGAPWSTGIETRLNWPATNTTRWWTAWEDPEQKRDGWRDPLVLRPLVNKRLWYGAAPWDEEYSRPGYQPTAGNGFVIPLLTLAEPEQDVGVSLVLSPEDLLLEMSLSARKDGAFAFVRHDHRISATNTVRFAMDLVAHEADWRGGLGWMARRYAEFFDPPNPRAHDIAGLGAYSDWEGDLETAKLKRMGFRVNWKASYDFPYMGMFLPPIPDTERYTRLVKKNTTSIEQLRDYSARMRRMGFEVLNYFNVTECGATSGMPAAADPALAPADAWRNVHNFMRDDVADGILLDWQGCRYASWEGCVAMDCGGPQYRAHLLEQARRHIAKLPDSAGICIDRLDWLRFYNPRADDGATWRRDQLCRSLYSSWRSLLAEMGPMFHAADKVIFVNALVNRTELLRHVDGVYHEFGHVPAELNGAALQCVRKPCIAWTPDEATLKPDPDAYFQRHLHLGVFPTAPLPHNDHTIGSSTWADRWYLDYGPLMDALRGKRWVLAARCVESATPGVRVNLFEVPGSYALPVTFGGANATATVRVRHVSGLDQAHCTALHPGAAAPAPARATFKNGELELTIPLQRGCAMVQLMLPAK